MVGAPSSQHTRLSRLLKGLGLGVLLIWLFSLTRWVWSEPISEVHLPRLVEPPHRGVFNLASYVYGPTLRASSADYTNSHHLAFAVDGRVLPSAMESWRPLPESDDAWFEVRFRESYDLTRVRLVFPSAFEANRMAPSDLDIICLPANPRQSPQLASSVSFNRESRLDIAIACPQAQGLHISFHVAHAPLEQLIGLAELEVFGP